MSTQGAAVQGGSLPAASRPAFDIFEGFALSSVLASLEMSGLLVELEGAGLTDARVGSRDPDAARLLLASLNYLVERGVVRRDDDDVFRLTEYGQAVCVDKGYLVWVVGGYGEPLRHLDAFVTGRARYGQEHQRDGQWVAGGAALLGRADVVPYALKMLQDVPFNHILDIGCGNARFLLLACQQFDISGVGVDLSPDACRIAETAVAAAGMGDRVQIGLCNATALDSIPQLDRTDLVVTFFLLHEILADGRDVLVSYLADLAGCLPDGACLLIAEVEPPTSDTSAPQRFTPEFTYVHAMMRQTLYSAEEWRSALTEGGFDVREVVRGGIPGGLLILCQKPLP